MNATGLGMRSKDVTLDGFHTSRGWHCAAALSIGPLFAMMAVALWSLPASVRIVAIPAYIAAAIATERVLRRLFVSRDAPRWLVVTLVSGGLASLIWVYELLRG